MKFSVTLACAAAPFALGARIRRDGHLAPPAAPAPASNHEAPAPAPPAHVPAPAPPAHVPAPAPPAHVPAPVPIADAPAPPGGHAVGNEAQIVIIWGYPGGEDIETTTYHEKVTVTQTVTVAPEAAHPTVVPGGDGVDHTVNPGETATVPAAAASHTVIVGGPNGNIFEPESLEAVPVGDTVIFEFLSMNHTVTQSPFDTPCEAMEGGMDSGFQANPDNSVTPPPQVAMQVMTEDPLWFYCRQGNHCGGGMVFSINPTAERTQADFKALAIEQNGEGADAPIVGGDPVDAPEGDAPPPPPADAPEGDAPPPPPVDAPAPPADGVLPGQGQIDENGNCLCVVSMPANAFPGEGQGVGANGGWAGGIPLAMAAAK